MGQKGNEEAAKEINIQRDLHLRSWEIEMSTKKYCFDSVTNLMNIIHSNTRFHHFNALKNHKMLLLRFSIKLY